MNDHELHSLYATGADVLLTLVFDVPLPEFAPATCLQDARALYATEARRLADALRRSLPGGLYHALTIALLDDVRGILSVSL